MLVLDYDFSRAQGYSTDLDEVSIVYPLSMVGMDLSDKTSFQLTMLGEEGGPQVNFAFGDIDEHSDKSSGMTTQCGTGVPKTEDVYCRNSLAPNEDIGWLFTNPDGSEQRYDPFVNNIYNKERQPNGRIDTQDLNGNGKYDAESIPTGGNFGFAGTDIVGLPDNKATNTTWQTFSVPLEIANKAQWKAVHHLRITLKKGTNTKGQIKIANVGLSGTAWNPNAAPAVNKFSISGINNVENANYEPIFNSTGDGLRVFNYLYGSVENFREANKSVNAVDQSLRLKFDTTSTDCDNEACYANRNFSTMDFTQHREFRFLLHGAGNGATGSQFFLKVGTQQNYDKIIVPVDYTGWRLISVKMVDTNGDGSTDAFENVSDAEYGVKVESVRAVNGLPRS